MKLRIAEGLSLPADAVTQTFGVLAKRGAGKSNAAAVLAEAMHAAGAQFVVVDPVGAWWGLRSSADGKGPGLSIAVLGGHHHDLPLDPGAGELVADLVVDERISCVLDVSAFESESAKRRFLTAFANRLFRQKGRPGSGDPLHLFLEEADDYAPQVTGRGEGERGACLGAFQRLVKQGRARGIGCTMITQRSAALNKDLLTQIETLIVLRTTAPNDRKAIEGWVKYHDLDGQILASLSELAVGEAWVWSPSWLGVTKRVQLPRRSTYDSGATAAGSSKSKPVATLADVDLTALRARMAATIEKAKADDPRELRKQVAALQRQLVEEQRAIMTRPAIERIEVPAIAPGEITRLEQIVRNIGVVGLELSMSADKIATEMRRGGRAAEGAGLEPRSVRKGAVGSNPTPSATRVPVSSPQMRGQNRQPNGSLPAAERAFLTVLAHRGTKATRRNQLAVLAGYSAKSRHVDNTLAALRSRGLAQGSRDDLRITNEGLDALGTWEPLPAGAALVAYWVRELSAAEGAMLQALVDIYPRAMTRDELAEATNYSPTSRHVDNTIAGLRTRDLITGGRAELRASEELFS